MTKLNCILFIDRKKNLQLGPINAWPSIYDSLHTGGSNMSHKDLEGDHIVCHIQDIRAFPGVEVLQAFSFAIFKRVVLWV